MKKLLWISVLLVTNCLSAFAQTTNQCRIQSRPKLSGTVIGTTGSWNNSSSTRDKVFDGNTSTYFDAPTEDAWVGLSFDKPTHITGISYFPRAGATARMIGGIFQGSNTADFSSGVVNLSLSIKNEPTLGWNCVAMSNTTSFKYVRYWNLKGGFGNVAEIEFYGVENTCDFNAPNTLVVVGTTIGTTGSWNNSSSTRDKAFDNDTTTFFDAPTSVAWTGLAASNGSTNFVGVKFFPRAGATGRMVGGKFQGSNTADFSSGVVDLATITTEPTLGWNCLSFDKPNSFFYVRYISPSGGFGNVAEIVFYGIMNRCPGYKIEISDKDNTICAGSSKNLYAIAPPGSTNFKWSPSTGLDRTDKFNVIASPTQTTTYTVTADADISCQVKVFGTVTVVVNQAPTVSVTASKPTINPGEASALTANGATSYTWSPSSGLSATTGASVVATPTQTTTYTVTGVSAGCSKTSTVTITVNPVNTGLTVWLKKKANTQAPRIHYWNVVPAQAASSWPGVIMTQDQSKGSDWYKYSIPNATSTNLLFHDNAGYKTGDLSNITGGCYDANTNTWINCNQDNTPIDNAPTLTVTPAGGNFTSPVTVTLTATDDKDTNPMIYYNLDGSAGFPLNLSFVKTGTITISSATALTVITKDSKDNVSIPQTFNYTFNQVTDLTVWMKKKANTQAPRIHYWDVIPSGASSTWPGELMTQDLSKGADWYKFTIQNATSTNLLFHDNAGFKTANMTNVTGGCYDANTNTWINCNQDNAPTLTVSPNGGNFTSPVTVSLSAIDDKDANPMIYYTLDGSLPTTSSLSFVKQGTITISSATTLRVITKDNANNVTLPQSSNYTFNQITGVTVWFKKPANIQTPRIHYWNVVPVHAGSAWPGIVMTQDLSKGADWYKFTLPNATSTSLLFHDNAGYKTADMSNITGGCYDGATKIWIACPASASKEVEEVTAIEPFLIVYPNPASENINIKYQGTVSKSIELRIFNMLGNPMYSNTENVEDGTFFKTIDTFNFTPGVYIVSINNGTKVLNQKLIIK